MMMCAIKRTLGVAEEPFRRVRGRQPPRFIVARVFLYAVIHRIMGCERLAGFLIEWRFIGIQVRRFSDMLFKQLAQSITSDLVNDLRTHATAALDQRYHGRFIPDVPP